VRRFFSISQDKEPIVAETPNASEPIPVPQPSAPAPPEARRPHDKSLHEINFVAYPKLLFIWPLVILGFAMYPFANPVHATAALAPPAQAIQAQPGVTEQTPAGAAAASARLEVLGWIYIWVTVLVLLTLGVDVDRNMAAFWILLVAAIYILGMWLHDVKGFTLFGDIYRWFAGLNVQYDRRLGLVLSILLSVPYLLMLGWARINDRWRITHNEFEHYTFGKMNDSLGRGAKTIRTDFPDVFELLLGLAGTLIVYNASGTRELRRIPHVMFLPFVRKRLNRILETTSVTAGESEEEEGDDDQQ
jgi:hypothetical protein